MRRFAATTLLLAVTTATGADDEQKKALEALKGEWKAVSVTVGGMDVPKEKLKDDKVVFDIEKMTMTFPGDGGGKQAALAFTFDPKDDPPTINFTWKEGGKDVTVPGIYKLEKGRLTICFEVLDKGARPREFRSDGGRTVLMVLEREKAEKK